MSSSVSPFTQALGYYARLYVQEHRQIATAFGALNGKRVMSAGSSGRARIPSRPQGTSSPNNTSAAKMKQRANTSVPDRSSGSVSPSVKSPSSRSTRTVTPHESDRHVNARKHRKSIANTQADKKGSDSSSMTSLETSGIDGKGLRINQIR